MKWEVLITVFLCATITGFAQQEANRKLICSYTFSSKAQLKDWQIEGEGGATIKNGKLILRPSHFPMLKRLMEEGKVSKRNEPVEYQPYVEQAMKKKYGKAIDRYYVKDEENGRLRFLGGNFNIWNTKFVTGENFSIEFDFRSLYPVPLHMVMFSAKGINGKSIFDPSFPPRYGLASEIMTGELVNYRLSFFEPARKTANLRRAPGRKLLYEAEDVVSKNPGKTFRCEIKKIGNQISYLVDGKNIFTYADDNPLEGGHWGFRLMPCTVGEYDNIKVYGL